MSRFTDRLVTEWYPERGVWRLARGFEFHSGEAGGGLFIRCPIGMETDLASIPRGIRWLIPKVGRDAQGAVVHDRGYQDGFMVVRAGSAERKVAVNRAMVDALYYQAMKALGVSAWRREAIYRGLQVGGWVVWRAYRKAGGLATDTTR